MAIGVTFSLESVFPEGLAALTASRCDAAPGAGSAMQANTSPMQTRFARWGAMPGVMKVTPRVLPARATATRTNGPGVCSRQWSGRGNDRVDLDHGSPTRRGPLSRQHRSKRRPSFDEGARAYGDGAVASQMEHADVDPDVRLLLLGQSGRDE